MSEFEYYIEPRLNFEVFTCPHCGETCKMEWIESKWPVNLINYNGLLVEEITIKAAKCSTCGNYSLWISIENHQSKTKENTCIYPSKSKYFELSNNVPEITRQYFQVAIKYKNIDCRVSSMFLRLSLESALKKYYNNENSSLAKLINKLKNDDLFKNCKWIGSLSFFKDVFNQAVHSNSICWDGNIKISSFDIGIYINDIKDCFNDLFDKKQ